MKKGVGFLIGILVLSSLVACSSGKRKVDIGGLYPIISKNGLDAKWGYMNKSREVIIQPQFEDMRFSSDGLACVFRRKSTRDHS